jgi:hypothetical protein
MAGRTPAPLGNDVQTTGRHAPRRPLDQAMLEQIAGVGYIAMVVSRLVTLLAARDAPRRHHSDVHDKLD